MIVDGNLPQIAYGAATFNPTGKGEKSVPVKYIAKKCEQRFPTSYEDEQYSTKMCYHCQTKTHQLNDIKNNHQVRGLRWCSTCRKFINRDLNACKNIGFSFMSTNGRPKYLTRNQLETLRKTDSLSIVDKRAKLRLGYPWIKSSVLQIGVEQLTITNSNYYENVDNMKVQSCGNAIMT
jgi:hypothetical protein